MPKINLYQSRTDVATGRMGAGLVRGDFTAKDFADGSTIERGGQAVVNLRKNEDAKIRVDMRRQIAEDRLEISKQVLQMEQSAELGAPGHTESVEAIVNARMQKSMGQYDKRFHNEFQANYSDIRASSLSGAMRYQATQSAAKMSSDFSGVTDSNITLIQQNPGHIGTALQDIDRLEASLAASGQYDEKAIADAADTERKRVYDNYAESLISGATSEQELSSIEEDLMTEGGMLSEQMSTAAFSKMKSFIKTRYKQIEDEAHNNDIEMAKAELQPIMTAYYADIAVSGGADAASKAAQARLAGGADYVNRITAITEKYGHGFEQLSSAASQQRFMNNKILREMTFAKADARRFAEVEVKFKAIEGNLSVEEIEELRRAGELTPSGYNAALSARRSYDRWQAAKLKGEAKEADREWKRWQKDIESVVEERVNLDAKNKIYEISRGLVEDVDGAIAAMPGHLQRKAKKARDSYEAKEKRQQDADQKEALKLAAERLEGDMLKDKFQTQEEAIAAVDEFEEKYAHTGQGQGFANALRSRAKNINMDGRFMAGITSHVNMAIATNQENGKSYTLMPDEMPTKQRELTDAALAQHEAQWRSDITDTTGAPPTPEEVMNYRVQVAESINYLPDFIVDRLRSSLRGSDSQAVASAAVEIIRWQNINPNFGARFKDEDFERANIVADHIKNGLTPQEALDALKTTDGMSKPQQDARSETWSILNQSKGRGIDVNRHVSSALDLEGLSSGDKDFLKKLDDDMNAAGVFNSIVRDAYMRGSPYDSALKFGMMKMRQTWGVTRIGGEERLMRYAPESAYGVAILSDKQNTEWISKQFAENISARVGHEVDLKRVHILLDPAIKNNNKPTYMVYYQGQIVFRGAVPDPAASSNATNNIKIKEALAEAQKEKLLEETRQEEEAKRRSEEMAEEIRENFLQGVGDKVGVESLWGGFTGAPAIEEY